jgi:hypothetical protein
MVEERRKRTRVPVGFDLSVRIQDKKVSVKTLNLSLSGVYFKGSHEFQAGDACVIDLHLSKEARLSIEGKILRSDDQGTVVTFQSMDEETFYHLKKILQLNSTDSDQIEQELAESVFD